MDKREAKRQACSIVVDMIENYTASGAITEEYDNPDACRLSVAFSDLQEELRQRAGYYRGLR